jgi:hypothetical protein
MTRKRRVYSRRALTSAQPTGQLPDELSFSDIFSKYKGKWVAVLVTKRDDNMQPVAGRVVAADNDRYRLRQKVAQHDDICITLAGEPRYPLFL